MDDWLVGVIEVFRAYQGYLMGFLLTLPRAYAFISSAQLLAPTAVPRMARNVAILVISMPLTPLTIAYAPVFIENPALFFVYFAKEFALGFILGYFLFWLFWAVQAAGTLIDNQRGAAIASSIDPLQGHEAAPLGMLFSQAFITIYFSVGGFLAMLMLLYRSYIRWPVTELLPIRIDSFPAIIFEVLDLGMRLTVIIAAPVVAIMFLAEFALAMVSRFAPQVQVFILAMPIKSALAIFILIFYIPILMDYALGYQAQYDIFFDRFYEMLRVARDTPAVPATP